MPASGSPQPASLHSSAQAILLTGRALNHLQFRLQLAWLTGIDDLLPPFHELWEQLRLLVRELGEGGAVSERLAETVAAARCDWEKVFGREAHHELLISTNRLAIEDLQTKADLTKEEILRERCIFLLRTVNETVEFIRCAIEQDLSLRQRECLSLAIFLDRGLHPVPPFCCFRRAESPPPERVASWEALPVHSCRPHEWLLPRHPVVATPERPDEPWFQEVGQRWQQLGLSARLLPRRTPSSQRQEIAAWIDGVFSAWEAALAAADELRGADETAEGSASAGDFGLRLDDDRMTVTRVGYETVAIPSVLRWKLLRQFVEGNGERLSLNDLSGRWSDLGGSADVPEPGTIRTEIGRLRDHLRCLHLDLVAIRNAGWRLEDLPARDS